MIRRELCTMIIPHTWPILVGCPTKAILYLISKTIPKGIANKLLQRALASNFDPQWT